MANSDLIQSVIKVLDILHAVSNTESGIRPAVAVNRTRRRIIRAWSKDSKTTSG